MSRAYAQAGVDLSAAERAVDLFREAVQSTYTPEVLQGVGAFGGVLDAARLARLASPVLVASTDGVGTKVMVAARLNRWDTLGEDLVNHCVNDILVQGARPLFFLDCLSTGELVPEIAAAVVGGIARACRAVGAVLLGGELAEMPGVYRPGQLELMGTIVGYAEREELIAPDRIEAGDSLLALPSTGLHTNGYTLARKLLDELDWSAPQPDLGVSPGEALLAVHRCYLTEVERLRSGGVELRGMAHITGGGIPGNLVRILPEGLGAQVKLAPLPPLFRLLQETGALPLEEMVPVFNLGVGMLLVVPPSQVDRALELVPELAVCGQVVPGPIQVAL